ncbi:hypothetical protein C4585_00165 [Candidatus Parcubacteria bacterium]|nr:MAG: hypothetical protein C4585_00165 [Candidatus Parcubacteria bacterium]
MGRLAKTPEREEKLSHRHLNHKPDGTPDDDFDVSSLRGRPSDITWTPPPIRFTKEGIGKIAIVVIIVALVGFAFDIGG